MFKVVMFTIGKIALGIICGILGAWVYEKYFKKSMKQFPNLVNNSRPTKGTEKVVGDYQVNTIKEASEPGMNLRVIATHLSDTTKSWAMEFESLVQANRYIRENCC